MGYKGLVFYRKRSDGSWFTDTKGKKQKFVINQITDDYSEFAEYKELYAVTLVGTNQGSVIYCRHAMEQMHHVPVDEVDGGEPPAKFASRILKEYAKENGETVRSTTDISPLEEWLIKKLLKYGTLKELK